MAGRSGFGSTATMIVTNTPAKDLAYTNFAYCSPSDLRSFSVSGSKLAFALVGDSFVLSVSAHESIPNGHIALNAIQRRHAKVSTGDSVSVSRFIPPDDFNLALLTLELEFVKKGTKDEQVDAVLLAQQIRKRFINQVMTTGQRVTIEYHGNGYIFTVNQAGVEGQVKSNSMERGMISPDTYIVFQASNSSGIKIVNQREAASSNIFKHKEFNLESLGIGGLGAEFADIFRRAFASRVFPPHVTSKLGIKHVKGMLLYGPPGTGKTLMARQIGKMLNGKEPKIVNGPEVLSKFVGETEKNVRDLFADAEQDQRTQGDQSDLHVIIFDEIDAICKSRGSTRDGTGVHDSIVNQLLTKIDGVESLNNVLLIGMTNRKDLLDEALLRPGRLEVQVEISLPDEPGRLQILQIHTNKMKENSFLAPDVNLQELAARTKNYSGAELEGVVKSAVSYALNRQLNMDDLTKPVDEESIKVTMEDFLNAVSEVRPAFGASTTDLDRCRLNGMMDCGARHDHIYKRTMLLAEQVRVSKGSPLVTCLLEGPSGSGKTAMARSLICPSTQRRRLATLSDLQTSFQLSLPRKMALSDLACTYAALILHDDGIPVTAEKIATLVKAANVPIESYWPGLFAKLFEKRNIDDLIMNVGSGGGGAAAAFSAPAAGGGAAAAPAAAAAVEEKKEEPKEESDDDMGFSLFD